MSAFQSAASVSRRIQEAIEVVAGSKKELQRRNLQNSEPQAPSGSSFTSKITTSSKSYTAGTADGILESIINDCHGQLNTGSKRRTGAMTAIWLH
jgi:hypothetical protein